MVLEVITYKIKVYSADTKKEKIIEVSKEEVENDKVYNSK